MNEPLHPLRLGEILDRTAQMYRARFLVFLGIAAIPAGAMFVLAAGMIGLAGWIGPKVSQGMTAANAGAWAGIIVLGLLLVPVTIGSTALGEAAMTDAAARSFLGYSISIRKSYKTAWRRGWRWVGILLLQGLAIFVTPMVVFGVLVGVLVAAHVSGYQANDSSPVFGGLVFLAFVVFGSFAVWMLLRLCLAFAASVVEQAGAFSALKRSNKLSAGTRGRILVLYILGLLLNQIIAWMVIFPALILVAMIPALQGHAHAHAVGTFMTFATYGAMFAVRALTKPVFGIGLTLFYFDQRIRKEGFDIEWMMQQAGMVAISPSEAHHGDVTQVPTLVVEGSVANEAAGTEAMPSLALQSPALDDRTTESPI